MTVDQAMRDMLRDELRQALEAERTSLVAAVVAEVRKLQQVDLLTTAQAAELAKVDEKTIRRWVQSGRLSEHRTDGGDYRIVRSELLALLGFGRPEVVADEPRLTDLQIEAKVVEMRGGRR